MLYKVVTPEGIAANTGYRWRLPTQQEDGSYVPGGWHQVKKPVQICRHGLHLTETPYDWVNDDSVIYAAEGRGEQERDGTKIAFERARLLYPVPHEAWWLEALSFVDSLATFPFFVNPTPDPDLGVLDHTPPQIGTFSYQMWEDVRFEAEHRYRLGASRTLRQMISIQIELRLTEYEWLVVLETTDFVASYVCARFVLGENDFLPHLERIWRGYEHGYAVRGEWIDSVHVYVPEKG